MKMNLTICMYQEDTSGTIPVQAISQTRRQVYSFDVHVESDQILFGAFRPFLHPGHQAAGNIVVYRGIFPFWAA